MSLLARLPQHSRRRLGCAAAIVVYLGAAYVIVGRGLLGDISRRLVSNGAGHDPSVLVWCLAWYPHAIANHLNPFLSRAVWWPEGVNLAWVPSIPGAALLAWPITRIAGPVASYNALSYLALPAAAFTMFLLCRDLTGRHRASIIGGFVFGFSPYFLGHLQNHLNLILAFPIPLAILLTARLLEGSVRRRIYVPLLAVLLVAQFLFVLELLATLTAVGIVALVAGFAIGPEHWRTAVRDAAIPIALAYALAAVLLTPYFYYLFAFGMPGSAVVSAGGVSTDLLNLLIPTESNAIGAHRMLTAISSHFGFPPEADGWIAWPLLMVIALYLRSRWRKPLGKVLVVMLGLLAVATLGPRLRVDGRELFGLPWKIVAHLPLIRSALPARLTMYIFLIIAVMTAVVLASAETARAAKYGLAIAIPIFMLPNLDYRFWTMSIDLPPFYTSGAISDLLHQGETAVVLPYAGRGDSMMWQALADFSFPMAGGYTGATMPDSFARWPAVNALYWGTEVADAATQFGAFFAAHNVGAIIFPEIRVGEYRPMLAPLNDICLAPTRSGRVVVFPVATDKVAKYRGLDAVELEAAFDRDRFERLLVAAEKYLEAKAPADRLTPANVAMAGLVPQSWGVDRDIYTKDGLILGPWKNGRIQVGVVGSYDALRALIADYRADASEVYFPFPRSLDGAPKGNLFLRKLVMVFERASLRRAAGKASSDLAARDASASRSK